MDVGSIILGHPWLYDADVTIYEKSNTCVFLHEGKRYRIQSSEPKNHSNPTHKPVAAHTKPIHLLNVKGFEIEAKEPSLIFVLVAKEPLTKPQEGIPLEAQPILKEFNLVF